MDVKNTLEFVDRLIFAKTGKHLSDLERDIFIGSWEGHTYEEIYPNNPEYVEKYVGYKFWQKLSNALGEKVTKKQFRGALARALSSQRHIFLQPVEGMERGSEPHRVFISYRHQEPDCSLARDLGHAIAAAGHQTLTLDPIPQGEWGGNWLTHLDSCLAQCDYFILLLSPQAAVSEMVMEELRRARELQSSSHRPVVLTVRVNCPPNLPISHDLWNYLHSVMAEEWRSPNDTARIIQEVMEIVTHQSDGQGGHFNSHPSGQPGKEPKFHRDEPDPSLESTGNLDASDPMAFPPPGAPLPPTPYPMADPDLPQGQVRLHSRFYIERVPQETQCYREVTHPGTLIRIKAPRQMGKTSLMSRILFQAREQGYHTVPLSFQHADKSIFSSLDGLLRWFCSRIARKLQLTRPVDQYWSDTYGSKDNCTAYFEDCLLPEIYNPLVLALDEVDRVFQYPKIADDFFGLLRAWYEEAGYGVSDNGLWEKLRLVVVHSTEVYIPLDVNQSPFNVGLPIELSEFSAEQVLDLAQRHGLPWLTAQVTDLMQLIGGHPYLVRLALYHITRQELTLDQLLQTAATEAGIYSDHLRRHLWHLQQHPELGSAFHRVISTNHPVELESLLAFKLHSLGLVQLRGNDVTIRFELYRQYFGDRLRGLDV